MSQTGSPMETQPTASHPLVGQRYRKIRKGNQWETFPERSFKDFQPEVHDRRTRSSYKTLFSSRLLRPEVEARQINAHNIVRQEAQAIEDEDIINGECSGTENVVLFESQKKASRRGVLHGPARGVCDGFMIGNLGMMKDRRHDHDGKDMQRRNQR